MRSRMTLAMAASLSILAPHAATAQQPQAESPASTQPVSPAATAGNPPTTAPPAANLPPVVVEQEKAEPTPKAKAIVKPVADSKPDEPAAAKPKRSVAKAPAPAKPKAAQSAKAAPAASEAVPAAVAIETNSGAALAPPQGTLLLPGQSFGSSAGIGSVGIAAAGGANLADVVKDQPGISGSTFAAGANRPVLRGQDNNRVLVTADGLGSGDVSALSEDHAVPVNPCAADSVTVLHGPATLRYGGAAIGGVVASESGSVPTRVPAAGVSGEVRGGVTSVDHGKDGCFKASAGAQGFVAHASGFARHADDYRTPHGIQSNTYVDSSGTTLGGSYVWRDGYIGAAFTRFDSTYGIPGIEAAAVNDRIDMGQDKVTARAEWRPRDYGITAIRASFGFSDYAHDELFRDPDTGLDTVGSRFLNKEREGRAEIEHMPFATALGRVAGTAGLHVVDRDMSGISFEGDSLLEPNHTRKIAAYLFEELKLGGPLTLLAAGRYEHVGVGGAFHADIANPDGTLADVSRSFDLYSGSIGARYELPLGLAARASLTYSERAPEAQELFSKGAHEATGTFEIGNPALHKEGAGTLEIGLERKQGDVRFDAAVFYTRYQGFIARQLTGGSCGETIGTCVDDDSEELKKAVFTQRDAVFHGVELSGEADVAPLWRGVWGLAGRYDFVRAQFEGGENVPRIAPQRLGGGIYYRDAALRVRIDLLHAFRQDDVGANETATSGYDLLSAEASYTFRLTQSGIVQPELIVGVKGENLLDDDVRNHVSFKKDEVLLPGQSVRAFGILRF